MTAFSDDELAAWAERKRVRAHLTEGRADTAKCICVGVNCLAAQAVADHFRHLTGSAE